MDIYQLTLLYSPFYRIEDNDENETKL